MRNRLDKELVERKLASTRSQAESYIKLGKVKVNEQTITKPGFMVAGNSKLELAAETQYVSRAALKLESAADKLQLDFRGKTVLDIGSSTGGFTDYALKHGARKVIAVDVGTDQLHPSLRRNPRVELHEKTDIRDFNTGQSIDIVVADVSFISLRDILPHVTRLAGPATLMAVMVKPQFEAGSSEHKHKGVIKNDAVRRGILRDFEVWAKSQGLVVLGKADSAVSGAKGNRERFYLLHL
jgi:23S rRNA (cytidine1920-2'-O)/16S rRNA (cytidine1409-2'-O)-methyltransferase